MSAADWKALSAQLSAALEHDDRAGTEHATVALVEALHDLDTSAAYQVNLLLLQEIRDRRRFDLLERIAEALLQTGADLPAVQRHYAQVLIERGAVTAGLAVAQALSRDGSDPAEVTEARGLVGRAYKELFLGSDRAAAGRRRAHLTAAIRAYRDEYELSGTRWHGINAAALLLRADRDGIAVDGVADPRALGTGIAAAVLDRLGDSRADGPWDWAIAIEANLARGDADAALQVLRLEEQSVGLEAFALASVHRQLVRVWQLSDDRPPGAALLPPLEALLLGKKGAVLTLDAGTGSDARRAGHGFEKLFGAEGAQTQAWFETLLVRCRGVARVEDAFEEPHGTGFVVAGPDLHPALPAHVLVTNAHVIPDAVPADDAYVTFRGLRTSSGTARIRVGRMLWTSPPAELDATLVELTDLPAGVELNPIARGLPPLAATPPSRVYVVGHPLGATAVKVSVHNNDVLDHDEVKLHYLAGTEQGSSGSPVFDKQWSVVALHHAGGDRMARLHGTGLYAANEGIQMQQIRAALEASPPN